MNEINIKVREAYGIPDEDGNVPESQDENATQSAVDGKTTDIDDSEEVSLDVNDSDE